MSSRTEIKFAIKSQKKGHKIKANEVSVASLYQPWIWCSLSRAFWFTKQINDQGSNNWYAHQLCLCFWNYTWKLMQMETKLIDQYWFSNIIRKLVSGSNQEIIQFEGRGYLWIRDCLRWGFRNHCLMDDNTRGNIGVWKTEERGGKDEENEYSSTFQTVVHCWGWLF